MNRILSISLPVLLLTGLSQATIITGTFTESLDLPGYGSAGPRVEQNLNIAFPSAGPHLTAANLISNPSSWLDSLNATFDTTTNVISITGDNSNQYQIITIVFSNLTFDSAQQVTGFAQVTGGNAVTANAGTFSTNTSFTANSVTITYQSDSLAGGNYFNILTGTDTYQLTLGAGGATSTPEPASMALMGLGLVGIAFGYRRKAVTASAQL